MNTIQPISQKERALAVTAHLGYLVLAVAVTLTVLSRWLILPSGLAVFGLGMWAVHTAGDSPFLENHLLQARRHHEMALLTALAMAAFSVWAGIFTWGIGAVMTLMALPIFLVAWMLPTAAAARHALQGEPYQYKLERRLVRSRESLAV